MLADVYMPNVLSETKKKKFVLQITKEGDITLYIEDFPYRPILTAYDVIPEDFELNFFSMRNVYNEKLGLFWGKLPSLLWERVVYQLLKETHKDMTLHPWFSKWVAFRKIVDTKCKYNRPEDRQSIVPNLRSHFSADPIRKGFRKLGLVLHQLYYR